MLGRGYPPTESGVSSTFLLGSGALWGARTGANILWPLCIWVGPSAKHLPGHLAANFPATCPPGRTSAKPAAVAQGLV